MELRTGLNQKFNMDTKDIYSECLKLDNQLCFPLYAAGREVVSQYTPFLKELNITYTQYIVFMVLWEEKSITVKDLGKRLYLDSGTLTPLLKKLEVEGYIKRNRDKSDERVVIVSLTDLGWELREKAKQIPFKVGQCLKMDIEDAKKLKELLYKFLNSLEID